MSTLKKRIPVLDPSLAQAEFNSFIKSGKTSSCDTRINLGEVEAVLTGYAREPEHVFYVIDLFYPDPAGGLNVRWGHISFSDVGVLYFFGSGVGSRPVSKSEFFDRARELTSQDLAEWLLWNLA